MALIICNECGNRVSSFAASCIFCGCPAEHMKPPPKPYEIVSPEQEKERREYAEYRQKMDKIEKTGICICGGKVYEKPYGRCGGSTDYELICQSCGKDFYKEILRTSL